MTPDAQGPRTLPARAILFSGHMIDAQDRARPRFPAALEGRVRAAMERELDDLGAGRSDIGVGSGACGSDLLFGEALLRRGAALRLYLPLGEPEFIERSVAFAGSHWVARYRAVAAQAVVSCARPAVGDLPEMADPYEYTNLWMLREAQRLGGGALVFVCVWDGEGGDGPGGTRHLVDAVEAAGGQVRQIDPGRLA